MKRFFHKLLFLILSVISNGVLGDIDTNDWSSDAIGKANKQVLLIEQKMPHAILPADLEPLWQPLNKIRQMTKNCSAEQGQKVEKFTAILAELGEQTEGEDVDLKRTRDNLEKEKRDSLQILADCKLLGIKSQSLLEAISERRDQAVKEHLLATHPGLLASLIDKEFASIDLGALVKSVRFKELRVTGVSLVTWSVFIFVTLAVVITSYLLRSFTSNYLLKHIEKIDFTSAMLNAFVRAVKRYGTGLLLLSSWVILGLVANWWEASFVTFTLASLVLLGFLVALTLGRTFFAPLQPAMHYLPRPEKACLRFWRALRLLSVVLATGLIVYIFQISAEVPPPIESLFRVAFATLIVFSLAWVVWDAMGLYAGRGLYFARFILLLIMAVGLGAEIMGFRNLSEYLLGGTLLTLLFIGSAWLLSMLFQDFCDSLDESRYQWEVRLKNWLGVEPENYLPGVFWLRLLGAIFLWGGLVLILLRIWDVSATKREEAFAYLTDGFSIGELTIVPTRILIALGLLVLLMSVISWLKKQLDEHWLQKARMEPGARNAVASIVAYGAASLAILFALNFAGFELGNLAIIAGALSVGIGFGLQNIVNNFISGLILLFERPVQKGDWVVVGNTEGYIRKISIRSTQIQTFDRADVIVPNSELISAQVTNLMLQDATGRLRVPIGVAYGSDVEKVRDILMAIAQEQPSVILNGSVSLPKVIFLGFGDSSLNFELRFFIRNIDEKLDVISNTNYAIAKKFAESSIEIPFPQRDLHIRSQNSKASELSPTDMNIRDGKS